MRLKALPDTLRNNQEAISEHLNAALGRGHSEFLFAIGEALRSHVLVHLASKLNMPRESVYRSFNGKHDVKLTTVLDALAAMNVEIVVRPKGGQTG